MVLPDSPVFWVTPATLAVLDLKATPDLVDLQVPPVQLEAKERQALQAIQVKLERKVRSDLRVLPVPLVRLAIREISDFRAIRAIRAIREITDRRESRGSEVATAWWGLLDSRDDRGGRDRLAPLERLGNRVQLERRDSPDWLELRVRKECLDRSERLVRLVLKGPRAHRVSRARRAARVIQDRLETPEMKV